MEFHTTDDLFSALPVPEIRRVLLQSAQEAEGRDLRSQGAALQGTVTALTGENEQLRQALDDVTGKVHN